MTEQELRSEIIAYSEWMIIECMKPNADPGAIYEQAKLRLADIERRVREEAGL